MVLPFEFILNRAGLDEKPRLESQSDREAKLKVALERKLLEVRNYIPDVSHILLEPVPLSANLSFLDTSLQDSRLQSAPAEDVAALNNPALIIDDDELDGDELDDDDDFEDDDSMEEDDDDDAFP